MTIPLKGKIVAETPSTVKTALGAVRKKSGIAKSKVSLAPIVKGSEQKRSPTGEEPRSKQQKTVREDEEVESESDDENDNSNHWQNRKVPNEDSNNKEKFQISPTIVTSKDTEAGGGLNLAVKRLKPNRAGPSLQSKKGSAVKPTVQEARRVKAAKAVVKDPKDQNDGDNDSPTSSTPMKASVNKRITRQTNEKEILDTFQNKDLTPGEWDEMAKQVLTRGVQKEAEQILTAKADTIVEFPPPGFSDMSDHEGEQTTLRRSNRQTKNQGPQRFGSPVSHSVKLISCEDDITDLNMAALEAYRERYATVNTDTSESTPTNTKFGLMERHLFKRRIGQTSPDLSKPWNAAGKLPPQSELEKKNQEKK